MATLSKVPRWRQRPRCRPSPRCRSRPRSGLDRHRRPRSSQPSNWGTRRDAVGDGHGHGLPGGLGVGAEAFGEVLVVAAVAGDEHDELLPREGGGVPVSSRSGWSSGGVGRRTSRWAGCTSAPGWEPGRSRLVSLVRGTSTPTSRSKASSSRRPARRGARLTPELAERKRFSGNPAERLRRAEPRVPGR